MMISFESLRRFPAGFRLFYQQMLRADD